MGIIPKVRNTIREKKNVRKCHVNSLARMELACMLREGLMSWVSTKTSPRSSTLNALYTYFNVICAMQIISGTLPDTYITA